MLYTTLGGAVSSFEEGKRKKGLKKRRGQFPRVVKKTVSDKRKVNDNL